MSCCSSLFVSFWVRTALQASTSHRRSQYHLQDIVTQFRPKSSVELWWETINPWFLLVFEIKPVYFFWGMESPHLPLPPALHHCLLSSVKTRYLSLRYNGVAHSNWHICIYTDNKKKKKDNTWGGLLPDGLVLQHPLLFSQGCTPQSALFLSCWPASFVSLSELYWLFGVSADPSSSCSASRCTLLAEYDFFFDRMTSFPHPKHLTTSQWTKITYHNFRTISRYFFSYTLNTAD